MKNPKTNRIILCALFATAPFLYAEEAPAADKSVENSAEKSVPQLSEQELHEMLGYLTALSGGVSSLQLDEAAITELARGLHKALSGEISMASLSQPEVQAALGEAQARAEAVQQSSEKLPGFSEGSLEKIGVVVSMQSGVQQLGFGADEADAIRDGFIEGASAKEMDPEIEAKMPAFQAFIQSRMEKAQAAVAAQEEKAREAAMAEFKNVADEWSQKDNINVVLETTQGDVEIELYPKEAPLAVANFVGHIENDYYDGLIFHRVIDGFMIQGGDPLGKGTGGESIWGKPFPDEFSDTLRFDEKGLLAMANSGPMTNGSQFFITTSKPNWLNDKHTIFGKVVEGYDNVEKIEKTETGAQDKPVEDQKIVQAYVKE
ncbi:peptidylprolyl isomerase [Coraliomargarita sinensis]|nr:peptidylprolyl isomerase [Coraliomargarita sinensis]